MIYTGGNAQIYSGSTERAQKLKSAQRNTWRGIEENKNSHYLTNDW